MIAALTSVLAFVVSWDDPGTVRLRGVLVVAVGVVVLVGSVYLLLATNAGSRLGFLLAVAGLSGWMVIMGVQWWIYGIGLTGPSPSWKVQEVVVGDLAAASIPEARDLSEWDQLEEGDPARGEAQATAGAALTNDESAVALFEAENDFLVVDAYEVGGKDPDSIWSELPLPHPEHYAMVQVRRVVPVVTLTEGEECPDDARCVQFGESPPPPEVDESAPVVSVVMIRDLGAVRLPPAVVTISSLIIFGVTCNVLHRRDKLVAEHRAEAESGVS